VRRPIKPNEAVDGLIAELFDCYTASPVIRPLNH